MQLDPTQTFELQSLASDPVQPDGAGELTDEPVAQQLSDKAKERRALWHYAHVDPREPTINFHGNFRLLDFENDILAMNFEHVVLSGRRFHAARNKALFTDLPTVNILAIAAHAPAVAITQTCQQLRTECLPQYREAATAFWPAHTFELHMRQDTIGLRNDKKWDDTPTPQMAQLLTLTAPLAFAPRIKKGFDKDSIVLAVAAKALLCAAKEYI
ncbi:hypothetical protein LTR08_009003 [Meristemomyces frigidus]|nr:hypothetical protein LTR08_009003 [Meristemomyces frigidus]